MRAEGLAKPVIKKGIAFYPVTTAQDFPNLQVFMAENVGIVIQFWQLEGGGFWLSLRNFIIGMTYGVSGIAAGRWILSSDILDRYVPPGLPLALAALATIAVFMFGLPFALCMWTKISPVPPFLIRRGIHIDPARDQFRVYRGNKLEITRQLSQLHTTTVEEHPKAYKEQMKGKVGVYSKQFMLFGWFGMGGGVKVPLFARWEWPYQNSLIEVQKAIELAKAMADRIGEAAAGGRPVAAPQGFGGKMHPAGDGGRPPLD
jgi:hypothetical protein